VPEDFSVDWEGQISPEYRILGQLGVSDHSTVYKALDQTDGEIVAIKHIPAPRNNEIRGGLREVSLLISMEHLHLVNCLDVRYLENGDFLIIYEFVPGGDLRDLLQKHGCLTLLEWSDLAEQLFAGLAYLHAKGIVHCDLKPENILVEASKERPGGRLFKVADFGVAHYYDPRATVLTKGTGSPAYMAPEAFAGRSTLASDLYSAGIILYEAITGERPFRGGVRELARSHSHELPDFSAIAWPSVRVLLSLLLQKQAAHRSSDLLMLQQIISHIKAEPMTEPMSQSIEAPQNDRRHHTFTRNCQWIEPDSIHLSKYERLGEFFSTVPFSAFEPVSLAGEPYLLLGDSSRMVLNTPDQAGCKDIFYALHERPYQIFTGDGFATSSASQVEIWNSAKFAPQHIETLGLRVSHVAFDEASTEIAWIEGSKLNLRRLADHESRQYPLPVPPGTSVQRLSFLNGQLLVVSGLLNPRVLLLDSAGEAKDEVQLPGPIIQHSPYALPEFLCWKNSSVDYEGPVAVRLRLGSRLRVVQCELARQSLNFIRFSTFGALLESSERDLLIVGHGGETHSLGAIPEHLENHSMVYGLDETYFYLYSDSKSDNRIIIYKKKDIL
jgi:serine/threonine protein kinase